MKIHFLNFPGIERGGGVKIFDVTFFEINKIPVPIIFNENFIFPIPDQNQAYKSEFLNFSDKGGWREARKVKKDGKRHSKA